MRRPLYVVLVLLACGHGDADVDPTATPVPPSPLEMAVPPTTPADEHGPASDAESEPEPEELASPESDPVPEPIGTWVSKRPLTIARAPRPGSGVRGSIPKKTPFAVYAFVDGVNCDRGKGWAKLGEEAYACLRWVQETDDPAVALAESLPEERIVPFFYARPRDREQPVPVYAGRNAYARGDAPKDEIAGYGYYAFVRKRRSGGVYLYENAHKRVVEASAMRKFKPSEFEGRNLVTDPVTEGRTLAWAVSRPVEFLREPSKRARRATKLPYHVPAELIDVDPDDRWIEMVDEAGEVVGHANIRDVRRWLPVPDRPSDLGSDDVWIDVELTQQTLTVMRGDTPLFVTLVSTGKAGDGTPPGIYRVRSKRAWGRMRNLERDSDDPYYVESVPWTQYFHKRFAIHGVYWHDRFGRRSSHGCVNLSPKDAARVFALTTPQLPDGWISAYEHGEDRGTVIRVRRHGSDSPTDKRVPVATPEGDPGADPDADVG